MRPCLRRASLAAFVLSTHLLAAQQSTPALRFREASDFQPVYARLDLTGWTLAWMTNETAASSKRAAVPEAKTFVVHADVSVVADPRVEEAASTIDRLISPREMELSAGTFGDPSRYLQTMAGVVSDNDERNDFLVRGGNPAENLFVIDGIEIPSINQLALSDTTGGFVSMLDAEAIQQIAFRTDVYDSKFDERLSSVVEISTRPAGPVEHRITSEVGIAGAGGSVTRPMGRQGSLFYSARAGILQYLTNDIGLNGVPHYRNGFVRAENKIDERNSWWGLSLTGIDSIRMTPSHLDGAETSPYDVVYSGWRNTTGVSWDHMFSARSFAVMSLSHAEQTQNVEEGLQALVTLFGLGVPDVEVYNERTADRITTAKYDLRYDPNPWLSYEFGAKVSVDALNYGVTQPVGLQNPYSSDPAPLNSGAMAHQFATGSSAAYAQVTVSLPREAKLVLGERAEQWALGGHSVTTGKALFSMPVFGRLAHVGYSQYVQMPSTLYLLSFNNLRTLDPIWCDHLVAGVMLTDRRRARVMVNAYEKRYRSYPVAAAYPQLSLANIADTFGQAFLMFPMVSQGTGIANGVELTVESHVNSRLNVTGTLAYARSWYAGLDGVMRRGNYDLPVVANLTGNWRMAHAMAFSWRYSMASGKPFTPDNLALSVAQNRDVYDLTQVNAVRSAAYSRLDFRIEQARVMRRGVMTWHVGLENALNHKNFYAQAWMPYEHMTAEQDQMPVFPDGGVKWVF